MASQAGQGSRDEGQKKKTKNGLGARVKLLKPTKARPDNKRGAWETSAQARADKGRREQDRVRS